MAKIFISYSRADQETMASLADNLRKAGLDVWSDKKITSGESFQEAIQREIDASKAVLVIWSETSVDSKFVWAEATRAGNKLIQVHVDALEMRRIPIPFNILHSVPSKDFPQIMAAVVRLIEKPPPPQGDETNRSKTTTGQADRRPFTRLRVEVDASAKVVRTEIIEANPEVLAFYGAFNDRHALIGLNIEELIGRLRAWMNDKDYKEFEDDQIRAAGEFGRHQWAAARVPIRLNSDHPSPEYRNKTFRPVMQTVRNKDESGSIYYAEVSYIEE